MRVKGIPPLAITHMFIDTHTHLYDEYFNKDYDQFIRQAIHSGVEKLYMPNCDSSTIEPMMDIARRWPDKCFPMMGLHPTYVKENVADELALVCQWLEKEKFAAVGEIGLDYYWSKEKMAEQKMAFEQQIDWALEFDLPIVIHSREATRDCIEIVRSKQNGKLRGVFHCFSGSVEEAREIIDLGFYLGIGGVVTYKSAGLQAVVRQLALDQIVLETDAPYLAPVPFRGKRNESSYLPFVAEKIADLKEMTIEEVGRITTENAEKLFALSSN